MWFWSVSLVDQLSGQFHIFLVDQKPISHFFGRPIFFLVNQKPFSHVFGRPIFFLVDQIYFWSTKKKIGRPKKCEIDLTIGRPKRLTKSTWTPLKSAASTYDPTISNLVTSYTQSFPYLSSNYLF